MEMWAVYLGRRFFTIQISGYDPCGCEKWYVAHDRMLKMWIRTARLTNCSTRTKFPPLQPFTHPKHKSASFSSHVFNLFDFSCISYVHCTLWTIGPWTMREGALMTHFAFGYLPKSGQKGLGRRDECVVRCTVRRNAINLVIANFPQNNKWRHLQTVSKNIQLL